MSFKIKGIHHIEFSVSDLKASCEFYLILPGFKIVGQYPHFIMFYNGNFYLGITDHADKLKEKKFSEFNAGLDHVSFSVSSRKDLDEALILFERKRIPHGEIRKLSNNSYVLAFRDPDNIQLELAYKES